MEYPVSAACRRYAFLAASAEKNPPYGLQFLARATNDQSVVAAARRFQSLTDWHERHPKIT